MFSGVTGLDRYVANKDEVAAVEVVVLDLVSVGGSELSDRVESFLVDAGADGFDVGGSFL